jgi:hypothetical protein
MFIELKFKNPLETFKDFKNAQKQQSQNCNSPVPVGFPAPATSAPVYAWLP